MYSIIDSLFTLVFPPKDARKRIQACQYNDLLASHRYNFTQIYPHIYSITRYKDPLIRSLVHNLKFKAEQRSIEIISACLARHIDQCAGTQSVTIIPLPSAPTRRRQRGWNQCELLARAIPAWSTLRPYICTNILLRSDTTTFQKKLTRAERFQAQRGSFRVHSDGTATSSLYVVIDDVVTTGATLTEALATLRTAGFTNCIGFAFAH